MEWTDGAPEDAAATSRAAASASAAASAAAALVGSVPLALPPGVQAEPPGFPVRTATSALPGGTRLAVSRYGRDCLMAIATQAPSLGTLLLIQCAPPARAATSAVGSVR